MRSNRLFLVIAMVTLAPLSVSAEESADYRAEMQQKMQSMSSEERQLYRSINSDNRSAEGDMQRYGNGSGDGSGQKKRNRYGDGNSGSGQGSQNRYGSQGETGGGYGRGGRH